MFKTLVILTAGVIAALMIGGVLEVQYHPDRLSEVPGKVLALATNKETVEQIRAEAILLKRRGESYLLRDRQQQYKIAVSYVKGDADRLKELIAKAANNPKELLPQANLLSASLTNLPQRESDASAQTVIDTHEQKKQALTLAQEAITKLKAVQAEQSSLHEQLTKQTQELEQQMSWVNTPGAVAGAKNQAPATTPSPGIPLKF